MCTLLVEVTHFNFRVNLMSTIVAALSRKSWDKVKDLFRNRRAVSVLVAHASAPCLDLGPLPEHPHQRIPGRSDRRSLA